MLHRRLPLWLGDAEFLDREQLFVLTYWNHYIEQRSVFPDKTILQGGVLLDFTKYGMRGSRFPIWDSVRFSFGDITILRSQCRNTKQPKSGVNTRVSAVLDSFTIDEQVQTFGICFCLKICESKEDIYVIYYFRAIRKVESTELRRQSTLHALTDGFRVPSVEAQYDNRITSNYWMPATSVLTTSFLSNPNSILLPFFASISDACSLTKHD